MAVEITRFEPNNDSEKASIIAEVDFYLPKMHLHLRRWRLIKTKQGGAFAAPPAFKLGEEWCKMVEFEGKLQGKLADEIIEACQPYMQGRGEEAPAPQQQDVPF